jgi:carbonic anhydrase
MSLGPRECLVLRNVGGRIASSATDIAALDSFFRIDQIIMIHHSNCGASHTTKEKALQNTREKRPDTTDFSDFEARIPIKEDNHNSVIEDLHQIRSYGFLRKDLIENVHGFWLDVETGLLTRVFADGQTSGV